MSASQAAAVGGVSAALANILARPAGKSQIQSMFSPRAMESLLFGQGLDREARVLQNNRLDSNKLNAQAIARALQFGGLNTEELYSMESLCQLRRLNLGCGRFCGSCLRIQKSHRGSLT